MLYDIPDCNGILRRGFRVRHNEATQEDAIRRRDSHHPVRHAQGAGVPSPETEDPQGHQGGQHSVEHRGSRQTG